MTDFIYGVANWVYLGLNYTAQASSAAYRKSVNASQQIRDHRSKIAARESPIEDLPFPNDVADYSYRGLQPGSHIRLLVIEPGHSGELLHCSLEHVDLDAEPQFNALSYCWGDISETRTIFCEGSSVSVTKNLYDALVRLRKLDLATKIWVDAVCINQKDKAEKKKQIHLMRRIYQQSEICFAWLGPHTELDALAFQLLNTIHDYLEIHSGDQNGHSLKPGKIFGKDSTTPGEWDGISRLFARPWFERVWTLEEFVLPRQALIMCGKFSFDAIRFLEVVEFIHSNELETLMLDVEGGYLQSLKVAALRKEFHGQSSGIDLFDTLRNARDRDAFDARDKVLGVLGICQTDLIWTEALGYHMSPEEIYVHVAKQLLTSSDPFRLFSACYPVTESSKDSGRLPSWVPDWSTRISSVPCLEFFEGIDKYSVGGHIPTSINASQSTNGAELLSIKGRKITSLKTLVYRYSTALRKEFRYKHYPHRSTCQKIGDWYFYIALGWFFECWENEPTERPEMTIEQSFLATCWSITPANCGIKRFWETIACAFTNAKRKEAVEFKDQLMKYARESRQHDVKDSVQTSFLHNIDSWTRVRKFCVTLNGMIGWVPIEAREEDVVCVFDGARLPYVLRRTAEEGIYVMIGHCFLHGIMFGEATAGEEMILEDIMLR
ncbi:MAG: hypothetical protein Q9195_004423 [Heterodermia aff. obscurata]